VNAALALFVAGLWGQIPLATEAELPTGERVTLAADQLLYEPSLERLTARGNTTLRTAQLTVRADEVVYDQATQSAWARGNVMFVSGLLAAVADEVKVDLRTLEAEVVGGLLLKKRNVTEAQLLAARTPQELKKTGETVLTLSGTRIRRVGPNEFRVDDLSFTPCDCDPTEPSWRVEASRADVELGERAILTWPVVYVYRVPVLALPWLYLPLSERRTGLLVPRPNFSALTGVSFEQPIYVTLGPSYDITLTPGGYRGTDAVFGIRGARLHSEFRYMPAAGTHGRLTLGLLYDLKPRRNPLNAGELLAVRRGLRGELSWLHLQDLGGGWRNRVDLGVISDGYYLADITADVLARQAEYLRSTAVLARRAHGSYFGVDAVFRQPIFSGGQPFGFDLLREDRDAAGNLLVGPLTFVRGPAVTWALIERTLTGPLRAGLRAEAVRLGPLRRSFGDEGQDGVYRLPPDDGQGNRRFDPGEREARLRLDVNPRFSTPFGLGRFAQLTPYLGLRETVWHGEVTGRTQHRGYALVGTQAETSVVGDFGGENGVRHRVTPYVDLRWAPFVLGGLPGQPYDAVDAALPDEGILQAVTEVRQELGVWQGAAYRELFRLHLGQGWDLRRGRSADSFAQLTLQQGPLSASAVARYDVPTRRWAQFSGRLHLDNGKGTSLFASYDDLLTVGSDPLRAGIDELVGVPLSVLDPAQLRRAQQLHAGLRTVFPFGLGARYEAVFHPAAASSQRLRQQLVGLSYGPGCECWRLEIYAWLRPLPPDPARPPPRTDGFLGSSLQSPEFGANLTIHQFGHFGTGG
jgi:LPS-assembly protein